MARGNNKGQSTLKATALQEDRTLTKSALSDDRVLNKSFPGIPIGRGSKSLLPIEEAYKKYPQMKDAIGRYEPYYNRYRYQMEGIPYDLEKAMDLLKNDLKEQLPSVKRGVSFTLGPFQQRESDGVLESKTRFKTIDAEFEVVARQRWTGPLEAGDPPVALQGEPEYFIRRVPWKPYKK